MALNVFSGGIWKTFLVASSKKESLSHLTSLGQIGGYGDAGEGGRKRLMHVQEPDYPNSTMFSKELISHTKQFLTRLPATGGARLSL